MVIVWKTTVLFYDQVNDITCWSYSDISSFTCTHLYVCIKFYTISSPMQYCSSTITVYQTTLSASWEICMQVRKQQLELDGTTNWFQIRKGVCQGCILSPCWFNLYAEYITWNAGLDEAQARIKISGRSINNTQMTPPLWQKVKRNSWWKWKRRVKELA